MARHQNYVPLTWWTLRKTDRYWAEEYDASQLCRYWAEEYDASQLCRSITSTVNKFLLAWVILFKRVNFRQYFVCLRERIFNCCNVLMSSWSSQSNSRPLSPRYYLSMDAIFRGNSGGDIDMCQRSNRNNSNNEMINTVWWRCCESRTPPWLYSRSLRSSWVSHFARGLGTPLHDWPGCIHPSIHLLIRTRQQWL